MACRVNLDQQGNYQANYCTFLILNRSYENKLNLVKFAKWIALIRKTIT